MRAGGAVTEVRADDALPRRDPARIQLRSVPGQSGAGVNPGMRPRTTHIAHAW